MELNGNLTVKFNDDLNVDVTPGSTLRIESDSDLLPIIHDNSELKLGDHGKVSLVIVKGGTAHIWGYIKCLDINTGMACIYPSAKIDIIHLSDSNKATIAFCNGADPNKYHIEMQVVSEHKEKPNVQN